MAAELLNEGELRELLQRDEGQYLEFKSLWDRGPGTRKTLGRRKVRDIICKYVAAFANADGGTLILGVEDDGTPAGHGYPDDAVQEFLRAPERRLRPTPPLRSQVLELPEGEVVVLRVGDSPEAVLVEGNGFPYRSGDSVVMEREEVINQLKQARRRVGWEALVQREATLDDLDLDLARHTLGRSPFADRAITEQLELFSLIRRRDDGTWAITNAALLLFARGPLGRWHPRAGLRFFRVAGAERRTGSRRNVSRLGRVEGPLARAIERAHDLARSHVRRSEKLHDLFFREVPEYPEFAWQEALVNACAHRDYADQGREIDVTFFEDRLEVASPGDLVPPVTLARLRQRMGLHASRNPLLVRVLVECGLMREEGEGIPRMFEEMEESLLHPPKLDCREATFLVTLRNELIFEGPTPEWKRLVSDLPLSDRQRRVLLAHPEGFRNEDYRRLNQVDRDQAYQDVQDMVSRGIVTGADARGRGAVYRPSPDLRDARAWLERRVPLLRGAFRTRPSIQNADYRELFQVTRRAATGELARLVDASFLVREGERRGARYLPGPAMRGRRAPRGPDA